jgi:hypothetical protein
LHWKWARFALIEVTYITLFRFFPFGVMEMTFFACFLPYSVSASDLQADIA